MLARRRFFAMGVRMQPSKEPEAPTGTLVIVLIYGVLFVVGWLAMYFGVYMQRGPIQ